MISVKVIAGEGMDMTVFHRRHGLVGQNRAPSFPCFREASTMNAGTRTIRPGGTPLYSVRYKLRHLARRAFPTTS